MVNKRCRDQRLASMNVDLRSKQPNLPKNLPWISINQSTEKLSQGTCLTIKLGGFLKANQNSYLKVAQRLGIRELFIYLYAEEKVKKLFTPAPFVSFRSGYSLRSHLVCAKVYRLIREKGSSFCGKSRCET